MSSGVLVDIGIATSYDYFFEVAWPNHNEFTQRPSPRTAVNAAWPYWHLHEWYFWEHRPAPDLKKFEAQVLGDCPELRWLRDIAEAGKHYLLHRKKKLPVKVKSILTRHRGGYYGGLAIAEAAIAGTVTELVIVDAGGATHNLRATMGTVFWFWFGKFLPYRPDPSLASDNWDELSECALDWCRTNVGNEREPKWKWALFPGANNLQRLRFLEEESAKAFNRWWAGLTGTCRQLPG